VGIDGFEGYYCNFCGEPSHKVGKVVLAPDYTAICLGCINKGLDLYAAASLAGLQVVRPELCRPTLPNPAAAERHAS